MNVVEVLFKFGLHPRLIENLVSTSVDESEVEGGKSYLLRATDWSMMPAYMRRIEVEFTVTRTPDSGEKTLYRLIAVRVNGKETSLDGLLPVIERSPDGQYYAFTFLKSEDSAS